MLQDWLDLAAGGTPISLCLLFYSIRFNLSLLLCGHRVTTVAPRTVCFPVCITCGQKSLLWAQFPRRQLISHDSLVQVELSCTLLRVIALLIDFGQRLPMIGLRMNLILSSHLGMDMRPVLPRKKVLRLWRVRS